MAAADLCLDLVSHTNSSRAATLHGGAGKQQLQFKCVAEDYKRRVLDGLRMYMPGERQRRQQAWLREGWALLPA